MNCIISELYVKMENWNNNQKKKKKKKKTLQISEFEFPRILPPLQ